MFLFLRAFLFPTILTYRIPQQVNTSDPESRLRTYVDTDIARSSSSSEGPAITLNRCFCSNCGSPLFVSNSEHEGLVVVTTGSMDNSGGEDWRPEHEFYCARRVGWMDGVEGATELDGPLSKELTFRKGE